MNQSSSTTLPDIHATVNQQVRVDMRCLINGQFLQAISPLDRGLAYGDGVFRTMRVQHGQVMFWSEHYAKLAADAQRLAISIPEKNVFEQDIQSLLTPHNVTPNSNAIIKIIVTRGVGLRGYRSAPDMLPMRIVFALPHPITKLDDYNNGVSLGVATIKLAHQPSLAGIKHLNRLENVLAAQEIGENQADVILLDQNQQVIETTSANLFVRYGNDLLTPILNHCGVAGVVRQQIMQQAAQLGLMVSEKNLTLPELMQADEVLLCNSVFGVRQVNSVQLNPLTAENHTVWAAQPLARQLNQLLGFKFS